MIAALFIFLIGMELEYNGISFKRQNKHCQLSPDNRIWPVKHILCHRQRNLSMNKHSNCILNYINQKYIKFNLEGTPHYAANCSGLL